MVSVNKFYYQEGQKINNLTFIAEDFSIPKIKGEGYIRRAKFKCHCGKEFVTRISGVKNGRVKSCGCIRLEKAVKHFTTHSLSSTLEYTSWEGIKRRCLNPNNKFYKNYGGRGITVCEDWLKFENFIRDMGNKPDKSYSIDRIDVNKGYNKENCIWSNRYTQDRNRTDSVNIEYKEETRNLCDVAREVGMHQQTLKARLGRGLPIEEAVQKTFKYIKSNKYAKKDVLLLPL